MKETAKSPATAKMPSNPGVDSSLPAVEFFGTAGDDGNMADGAALLAAPPNRFL